MFFIIVGHSEVTSKSIDTKSQKDLPEFAMLDMISAYVLGERKRIYKGKYLPVLWIDVYFIQL